MKNILITGSKGQLGSELRVISNTYPQYTFFFEDADTLDISDFNKLEAYISKHSISIIINAAAYTAVDNAEKDTISARLINSTAVEHLAHLSKKYEIRLIHISTDYVFNGTAHIPYTEDIETQPIGMYGRTKLDGEIAIQKILNNAIIIRTSWLYSSFGNNFVKTILRLANEREQLNIIFDQIGTPTYAKDLADSIMQIVEKSDSKALNQTEIFHYSNEGVASWYDFAKAIIELNKINCEINPIETHQYPTPAKRPAYSVLNKNKIKNTYQITIPYWRDSLKKALEIINQSS